MHHGGTKWEGSFISSAVEMQLGVFGQRPRVLAPPRSRRPRVLGRSPLRGARRQARALSVVG